MTGLLQLLREHSQCALIRILYFAAGSLRFRASVLVRARMFVRHMGIMCCTMPHLVSNSIVLQYALVTRWL